MKTFKYHNDPGHGWLAVKLDLLDELDLIDKISNYSYIRGKTAYLEEDVDCVLFVNKYKQRHGSFEEQSAYYSGRCPVRGYDRYSPNLAREILEKTQVKKRR
jgi:hypothetical protein